MKYIIIVLAFLLQSCSLIISGSYPYRENYEFDTCVDSLQLVIDTYYKECPDAFIVEEKNDTIVQKNSRADGVCYFYNHYWFHVKDNAGYVNFCAIVHCRIGNPADLGLVIAEYCNSKPEKYVQINTDEISSEENTRLKKLFEEKIVSRLRDIYAEMRSRGNNMSLKLQFQQNWRDVWFGSRKENRRKKQYNA